MPEPIRGRRRRVFLKGRDLFGEFLEHEQRQSDASLAVGRGAEGEASEVNDMPTRGVAVEHLEEKKRNGRDGVEQAISPPISRLAAGRSDRFRTENFGEVLAKLGQNGHNGTEHGRDPSDFEGVVYNPQDARSRSHAQEATS